LFAIIVAARYWLLYLLLKMNILITGASSGIGNGLAKKYLELGHTVYAINRRECPELSSNDQFHLLLLDLAEAENRSEEIKSFIKRAISFDLVILNAGILNKIEDMQNTSISSIKKVMEINVWSNKVLIDSIAQNTKTKQIIGISSGASVSGSRGWNAYSLSKATLNMLIKLYAEELPQIHFCALAPGVIDTAMQDYIFTIKDNERFPTIKRLQEAKGDNQLPSADEHAHLLIRAFNKVIDYKSGSFLDVRKMGL